MKTINIELKDSLKYKASSQMSYFINFPYSEYLVLTLKQLPKRCYHADSKTWEVPAMYKDELNAWLQKVTGNGEHDIIENGLKKDMTKLDFQVSNTCDIDLSKVKLPKLNTKIPLLKHQEDAVKYGILKGSFLLGDEMGLGKTASAIHYALYMKKQHKYKHCLVIAGINGLKWNWLREIEKHSNEKGWVLGMRQKKRQAHVWTVKSTQTVLEDLTHLPNFYFLVINIEKIRDANINKKLIKLINDGEIEMVIIDECQVVKSSKSQQTKSFLALRPPTRLAMTGTPMMNNPLELWTIFNWLGVDNHSFYDFRNYHSVFGGYMNKQIVEYKNLDDIQSKLQTCMLRRLSKNVLDLPEKVETLEYIEMNDKQWGIYDEVRKQILNEIDKIRLQPNPLTSLIRLRQATADTGLLSSTVQVSAKMDRLEEIAEELVENGKKFIVFSNWSKVIAEAERRLSKYKPAVIVGEVKEEHREMEIARFRTDKDCHCIMGTTTALGTGYTLTEATTVIFLDDPWNRATKDQAEMRALRIGQGESVNVITLICAGTIDERIEEIVYKKGVLTEAVVDLDPNDNTKIDKILDHLLR